MYYIRDHSLSDTDTPYMTVHATGAHAHHKRALSAAQACCFRDLLLQSGEGKSTD